MIQPYKIGKDISVTTSRAWKRGSMPYSAPKDGTPGSENSFPDQEIIIASKSRLECTIFLIFREYP
jgi:hypothetical protein